MTRYSNRVFCLLLGSVLLTTLTTVFYLESYRIHKANNFISCLHHSGRENCLSTNATDFRQKLIIPESVKAIAEFSNTSFGSVPISLPRTLSTSTSLYYNETTLKIALYHYHKLNHDNRSSAKNMYVNDNKLDFNIYDNKNNSNYIYSIKEFGDQSPSMNNSLSDIIPLSYSSKTVLNSQYFKSNNHTIERFLDRRIVATNECSQLYNNSHVISVKKEMLEHIIVDENHKLLFCYVPKVACTNWKRIFMLLTGKSVNISYVNKLPANEVHAKNLFSSLQNYTAREIDFFLKNYTKVIFVRNPLERLLSAYKNKFEQHYSSSKYFQSRFGKYIVKNFRSKPTNASLVKGDDVTFSEFVKYLVASSGELYNEHWRTINDLCYPCHISYDIIGKYESLLEDSSTFFKMLGEKYTFPELPKPSRTAASLYEYYYQLPTDLIKKLYKIYEYDFRLFNYDIYETLSGE